MQKERLAERMRGIESVSNGQGQQPQEERHMKKKRHVFSKEEKKGQGHFTKKPLDQRVTQEKELKS